MKLRILITCTSYLPGFRAGGPVRSIAGLIQALGGEFEMLVLTSDRDFKSCSPYTTVESNAWNRVGKAQVYYVGKRLQTVAGIARLLCDTRHDLLYLNSYFCPRFSTMPMVAMRLGLAPTKPVLIAPRGEFSAGAYGLKRWKKWPFTQTAKTIGLHRNARWHASTEMEATDLCRVLGVPRECVHIARNLTWSAGIIVDQPVIGGEAAGRLRVCFLSRISRMKNLDYALRLLKEIDIPVLFRIYGPAEDQEYWQDCKNLISKMPAHVDVRYEGSVTHEEVVRVISQHDVLLLPTRGESYGHVFVESWSAGVPVLTSDRTPWTRLEEEGVGWAYPLEEPAKFMAKLRELSCAEEADRRIVSGKCRSYADQLVNNDQDIASHRRMFIECAERYGV